MSIITLNTRSLPDSAVTTAKIASDAVTDAKIADDVIGTEHLTAGEVDATALASNAVTTAKIADSAVTAAKTSGVTSDMFRNIIINGDMSIAQRGTSASSLTGSSYETVDRFKQEISSQGTWTQSQSTDVPTGQGFAKSFKMDCTTADASPAASDQNNLQIKLEGQNLQYLKKGTSSAESITCSFWVRSNKTGTYIVRIKDNDNSRSISQSYTISSADTWEKKTLTYAGDTTGTLNNDANLSMTIDFCLGAGTTFTSGTLQTSWGSDTTADRYVGQVNLADSTSNEWYITGVQLEVGTAASDFEFLPTDINLERCQRYYYFMIGGGTYSIGRGGYYSSSQVEVSVFFPRTMRAIPTLEIATGTDYYNFHRAGSNDSVDSLAINNAYTHGTSLYNNSQASGTAGHVAHATTNNSSSKISFTSEL